MRLLSPRTYHRPGGRDSNGGIHARTQGRIRADRPLRRALDDAPQRTGPVHVHNRPQRNAPHSASRLREHGAPRVDLAGHAIRGRLDRQVLHRPVPAPVGGSRKSGPSPARLRLSPMVRGRRQPWRNHRPSPSHPYGWHHPRRRLRPLRPVRGLGAAQHSYWRPSWHAVQLLKRRIQGAGPPAGSGRRRRLRWHHPVADTGTARHGGHPSGDHAGHSRPHGSGVLATVRRPSRAAGESRRPRWLARVRLGRRQHRLDCCRHGGIRPSVPQRRQPSHLHRELRPYDWQTHPRRLHPGYLVRVRAER